MAAGGEPISISAGWFAVIAPRFAATSIAWTCYWSLMSMGFALDDDGPLFSYYIAAAVPNESLQSILNAASPFRHDGRVFFGHTDWHVQWYMRWSEGPQGSCKITEVNTKINGTIILPKLVNATTAQQERFNALLAALRVHEMGHYEIARRAAADIESGILSMPQMNTCAALQAAANERGTETLDQYKAIERKYDVDTDHGRKQGAWLD
jgi:predicted secreted Zn-dependent protease